MSSGRAIFHALEKERPSKYNLIFLDPKDKLDEIFRRRKDIDIAFILLHGRWGEDGTMQGMMEVLNIPYVGSGVLASALALNKVMAKELYRASGLEVPRWVSIKKGEDWDGEQILSLLGGKVVVKPAWEGSSLGISICSSKDEIREGIEVAMEHCPQVLVEEHIEGVELTCCVMGNEELETFPLIEIRPTKGHAFFDYKAKYTPGATQEICPAPLSEDIAEKARRCGITAHQALGCQVWSRTDMIVRDDTPLVLETNTIPGMTETSLFPLAAKTAGLTLGQLAERLIELSMEARGSANPG